jgi:sulfite reductase (NADPH) flavoprotein alpha-component
MPAERLPGWDETYTFTIHEIVTKEGGLSADRGQEYVTDLKEQHRYHRDLY